MTILTCPIPGCGFATQDVDVVGAAAILTVHNNMHIAAPPPAPAPAPSRGPKLERPKLALNSTNEDWNAFFRRWESFRLGSGIQDATASGQLLECTSEQLGNIVLRADPNFTTKPLNDALQMLKSVAVIPVALGVLRAELFAMKQDPDETFRTFSARVQGKAEVCEFKTDFNATCNNCNNAVTGDTYYTDDAMRDVLLGGIADIEIRREALSADGIQVRPIAQVIAFVESRETARNANPLSSTLSALSTYRKSNNGRAQQKQPSSDRGPSPTVTDRLKTAKCPDCGEAYRLFTKKTRGWNRRPHKHCENCWWKNRPARPTAEASIISTSDDPVGQISSIKGATTPLKHHIFNKGEWRRARVAEHPTVQLHLSADGRTPVHVAAVADSGAQSDLWSLHEFLQAGFTKDDLSPVSLSLHAANKSPIKVSGALFATISGKSPTGDERECKTMVYVSPDVRSFYLSFDTMLALGILNRDFPSVGSFPNTINKTLPSKESVETSSNNGMICGSTREDGGICDCPKRMPVPGRPDKLPFPCTPDNNGRMKTWLLERFKGSTFNKCPHQQLPTMSGPPVEIHIKDDAKPVASHKASTIPLHWQEKVHADLKQDEALGVIERVPFGEPVEWCHRMVVTRKEDGSPRRTVDLSPLNKFCKRETHNSESPFHLARRVPRDTWKTVTDAWNGFHSVPLRDSDRHLTTFITPFGRWRYKRAPQGFLSSGDGYNRRFDAILAEFERKERIVDDTIHYDSDLEDHWWRTMDLLSLVGNAGIILNPDKFQFAEREVDFAGFHISEERIEPLPKFFDAIKRFPTPTSTTDIRSWFGLVNQVANYAQLRPFMEKFRPFLSPRCPFEWTPQLDDAFKFSKQSIVNAIEEGVEIFDHERPTCLYTDWSKKGVGYFLLQKHCQCNSSRPSCCIDGWRITLAGSRFLSDTEKRYAPIEGEALAIAWSLEQTKFFTMGCHHLIIATDHKPLTKLFGDRTLDEIPNTRLFRLKQRTLPWSFHIIHLPGKFNLAADAISRHPVDTDEASKEDKREAFIAAAIRRDTETVTSLTWDHLKSETSKDIGFQDLLHAIRQGFQEDSRSINTVATYWRYRHNLYEMDGVVVYNDRVVVPPSLRSAMLATLHSAHQGVSSMGARARTIIFWPGMTEDIERIRDSCRDCIKNAPSQAPLPAVISNPPSTPFEMIHADYFDCVGQHYLVIGDRLSGWCDVFKTPHGSPQAGSEGLITCLRNYFSRFGVPQEISSDGGPEFVSHASGSFLKQWGVTHRLSSAYNPQSNGRAEVAVKSAKRLLRSNTGPSGSLNSDRFLRAMMQLRNTPDRDCELSPAQIVFGRPLRDAFAFASRLERFTNQNIRPLWRDAWTKKEDALRERFHRSAEKHDEHSRALPVLKRGDRCYIQNQAGHHPKRWDRSGTVVELHGNDSYTLKVDGTGRVTRRNRRFLRHFLPASPELTSRNALKGPPPTIHPTAPTVVHSHSLPPEVETPERQCDPVSPVELCQTPQQNVKVPSHSPQRQHLGSPGQSHGQDSQNNLKDVTSEGPPREGSSRPRRMTRRPAMYEPETGHWI